MLKEGLKRRSVESRTMGGVKKRMHLKVMEGSRGVTRPSESQCSGRKGPRDPEGGRSCSESGRELSISKGPSRGRVGLPAELKGARG